MKAVSGSGAFRLFSELYEPPILSVELVVRQAGRPDS